MSTALVGPRIIDPDSLLTRTALEVLQTHAPADDTPAEAFVICVHCHELSPCAPARNAIAVCLASGTRPTFDRYRYDDVEPTVTAVAQRSDDDRRRVPRQMAKATVEVRPGRVIGRVHVDSEPGRPGPIRRWMALIEPTAMFTAITGRGSAEATESITEPEPYDPDLEAPDNVIDASGWSADEFYPDDDHHASLEEHAAAA